MAWHGGGSDPRPIVSSAVNQYPKLPGKIPGGGSGFQLLPGTPAPPPAGFYFFWIVPHFFCFLLAAEQQYCAARMVGQV